MENKKKGWVSALVAYGLWGFLPIYWKQLKTIDSLQVLAHRIFWSFVTLLVIQFFRGKLGVFVQSLKNKQTLRLFAIISILITFNWYIYIWAVNSGFIIEASLGYFINPLVNVLMGVTLLKERPSRSQWSAVGLATLGVIYLTISYGHLPFIALGLAFTFSIYGFLKKKTSIPAIEGLTLETFLIAPFALSFLVFCEVQGTGQFLSASNYEQTFMVLAGLATSSPLLFFAMAAQRLSLTSLGLLQYLAPTLQFLTGLILYSEPFGRDQLIGFSLIWSGLGILALAPIARRLIK